MSILHYPVMYRNVLSKLYQYQHLKHLKIADCNFGLGGHSHHILKNFSNAQITAYEWDSKVIQYYRINYFNNLQQSEKSRLTIHHKNYTEIINHSQQFNVILADLGYNTFQLLEGNGFSWKVQSDLDMRYNQNQTIKKASEIINNSSELEIFQILKKYGELKEAKQVASAIVANRPIQTTFVLRDIVVGCFQKQKTRKIAQTFQALRISTNNQLDDLLKLCQALRTKLTQKGLAMILTFHSLQRDVISRFVKQNRSIFTKIVTQIPDEQQCKENSKSLSAKLVYFYRI